MTNIFVAKLDFGVSDDELKELFEEYGVVTKCQIAKDRETGKPRGFAFVEMRTPEETQAAIKGLDGHTINGRDMVVKIAEDRSSGNKRSPRPQRPGGHSIDSRPPRPAGSGHGSDSSAPRKPEEGASSSSSDFSQDKVAKRGKNKKKKSGDKSDREFKMSAYKKSGKKPRVDFEEDDDWELELLKQKRRGWTDDED